MRTHSPLALFWRFCLTLMLMAAGTAAGAQTFPKFTGLVVDAANVLPPDVETSLTTKLEALQQTQKRQLVVVTVPDTQGYALSDYGYRLGREWGVGLGDVDNGAILLIAPGNPAGQRGPHIEVGRGLEPVLTDALSSVIIYQRMMPLIRAGQVPQAVEAGTDAIIAQLDASPDEAKARTDAAAAEFDKTHRRGRVDEGGFPVALVFWGMVLLFVLLSFARGRGGRGRRYRSSRGDGGSGMLPIVLWGIANEIGRSRGGGGWGAGGGWGGGSSGGSDGSWGGGGFTGGGGGDFGGGGASGDW